MTSRTRPQAPHPPAPEGAGPPGPEPPVPARVLVVSDRPVMRFAMQSFFGDSVSCQVTIAASPEPAGDFLAHPSPDIVLIDYCCGSQERARVWKLLEEQRGSSRAVRAVVFGDPPASVLRAVATDVAAVVSQWSPLEELAGILEQVAADPEFRFVSPRLHGTPGTGTTGAARRAAPVLTRLTGREREVLRLVLAGQSSRDIAAQLQISPNTVSTHRQSVLRKTGARSLVQLLVSLDDLTGMR